jgi:hypothetical protein
MNRRQFLRISAIGAAATLASTARGADAAASYDVHALAHPDLLSVLGPQSVREIGARYREIVPAENHVDTLRAAILAARPLRVPGAPRPAVAKMVRDDFAAGRTIVVQGWVLSATEARQCALFSLLSA